MPIKKERLTNCYYMYKYMYKKVVKCNFSWKAESIALKTSQKHLWHACYWQESLACLFTNLQHIRTWFQVCHFEGSFLKAEVSMSWWAAEGPSLSPTNYWPSSTTQSDQSGTTQTWSHSQTPYSGQMVEKSRTNRVPEPEKSTLFVFSSRSWQQANK